MTIYYNQLLSWKHVLTTSKYNETATSTTTNIKGRKEQRTKLVRNSRGEEVVSSGRVFTDTAIFPDDYIDGGLILSVEPVISLNGTVHHYEANLQ